MFGSNLLETKKYSKLFSCITHCMLLVEVELFFLFFLITTGALSKVIPTSCPGDNIVVGTRSEVHNSNRKKGFYWS